MNFLKISLFIICICQVSYAATSSTITWEFANEPPTSFEKDGKYVGFGIEIINNIQSKIPQYKHRLRMTGNYKRLAKDVKEGELTCAINLFKTQERLSYMHFSKVPMFSSFELQIVLRKSTFEDLGKPKKISLREILQMKNLKFGTSHGRTYSKNIRKILKDNEENSNINSYAQSNVASSLLKMLVRNRFDYMFLYPEEAFYLSKNLENVVDLVTVPIEEIGKFSHTWAVCTKNKEGEIVAGKITEILQEIRAEKTYMNYYMNVVSQNLHEYYKEHYRDVFLKIYEE